MRQSSCRRPLRIILPPVGNQMIGMLKTSALVSVVAVQELLLVANQTAASNFRYFEALTAAGIYYLALTTLFMWPARPGSRRSLDPKRGARRMAPRSRLIRAAMLGDMPQSFAESETGAAEPRQSQHLLEMIGINKSFGSLQALKDLLASTCRAEGDGRRHRPVRLRASRRCCAASTCWSRPTAGTCFSGSDITRELRKAHLLRSEIGMVFQNFELFQHLTAAENIMLAPMKVLGMRRAEAHDIAVELLAQGPDSRQGGRLSRRAVRRPAAARRHRPRARHEADADALRRADLGAGSRR